MLEIGTKAPGFQLPDQNGETHTLEEYRGKKVVLYFYPRDNTPAARNRHALSENCIRSFRRKALL